jgi:hypothetical protein
LKAGPSATPMTEDLSHIPETKTCHREPRSVRTGEERHLNEVSVYSDFESALATDYTLG